MHHAPLLRAVAVALVLTSLTTCKMIRELTKPTPRAEAGVPLDHDDLVVRSHIRIRPGVYHVTDVGGDGVIQVRGPGAVLDLRGVTLIGHPKDATRDPDAFAGVAISLRESPGARVIGGTVRGFKVGLRAEDSNGIEIDGLDASGNFRQRLRSTVEREDLRDWLRPHDNDNGDWEAKYGAGISLSDSADAVIHDCTVRRGQNGILLTRSHGARVYDNDFSFNSGWGIALYRTDDCVIARNRADWCVRGYSHGVYDRGQDSTGILVFEQCNRNVFALNSATHGGDGFFLYAGEETLRRTGTGGCNDNIVWRNDFSHAVANAIEATFSNGNHFVENRLDDSRHGVWAGYSSRTLLRGNHIRGCDNGISIEHGNANVFQANEITGCGTGLHLWWDEDPGLVDSAFGRAHDVRSYNNQIGPLNTFLDNTVDLLLEEEKSSRVTGNVFGGPRTTVRLRGDVLGVAFGWNPAHAGDLRFDAGHEGEVWYAPPSAHVPQLSIDGDGTIRQVSAAGLPGVPPPTILEPYVFDETTLPGTHDTRLSEDAPRGRRFILIDEWGPVDPEQTRLFAGPTSSHATFSVLGVDGRFRITDLTDGFEAEPREGPLPATFEIRRSGAGRGVHPFQVEVEVKGERHRAGGTIFASAWDVRFFNWGVDPREDPAAWQALLRSDPIERMTLPAIAFDWQGGKVSEKVGSDYFATLATTELDLPAGVYDLKTVSDDGIRVWVDGNLVVDDWTHHGPTPHDATLELGSGIHSFRIEHFELTGWSVLNVSLVPR